MTDLSQLHEEHLGRWKNREEISEHMIVMIGKLYREKNIIVTVFDRSLVNSSVIQILKAHRRVRFISNKLSVTQTLPILEALLQRDDIGACQIDVGKIAKKVEAEGREINEILDECFAEVDWQSQQNAPTDVVLYGFGRIGRILTRLLIEQAGSGNGLKLKAIVVRKTQDGDIAKRASLLRRDSIHGSFAGTIDVDEENEAIIANGNLIKVIYANNPAEIDYTQYGINNALVIDNTGKWRDEAGLSQHLQAKGVNRVVLTAPGKGELKNIVYGVNDNDIAADDKIISAASCTTNAITPILKVLNDEYGIENGHVETVHSFTNDQNLIDNYHKADRRGRSAVLNMVITETGAAKAVAKALPELKGKLTGNSVRVPTPNVSLAILNLTLDKAPESVDALNDFVRDVALHSDLQGQIDFINSSEVVSTDFIGSRAAGVYDAQATILNNNHAAIYMWYDNEVGYSCQVMRIANNVAGIHYVKVPVH